MSTTRFPNWEQLYKEQERTTMPWYSSELDQDLALEIKKRNIDHGRILDLGTGPGTQAYRLCELGFEVTGSDLSEEAIRLAHLDWPEVDFIQDDILDTELTGPFDYIFDRGCFHVMAPEDRSKYLASVSRILRPQGLLFLKSFSEKQEAWDYGPYRFTPKLVKDIFGQFFELEECRESEYQGTLSPAPRALFCVLRRR